MLGRTSRWLVLRLLAVLAMIALQGAHIASAQRDDATPESDEDSPGLISDTEYESPQFGYKITWGDEWEVADPEDEIVAHAIGEDASGDPNWDGAVASDPANGDIIFLTDTATHTSVLSISWVNAGGPIDIDMANESLDSDSFLTENLFLEDGATQTLFDTTDDSGAVLGQDTGGDEDHYAYIAQTVSPDEDSTLFWTGLDVYDPAAYGDVLDSMTNDIEVDSYDLFPVFSADDMLAEMGSSATDDGDEDVTPEADDEETPAADDEETPEATEESEDEETPTADDEETPEATEESEDETPAADDEGTPEADDEEAENPGLIEEGEYVSPQFDTEITWTNDWESNATDNHDAAVSEEGSYDGLFLTDADTGLSSLYITVEGNPNEQTADSLLEGFQDPDYIEDTMGLDPDAEVLLAETDGDNAAVVYLDETTYGGPVLIILEAHIIEGGDIVTYTDFRVAVEDVDEAMLDSLAEDVEIGGDPSLQVFTSQDIIDEIPAEE